jgi:arylsulfatase A-like enzyme
MGDTRRLASRVVAVMMVALICVAVSAVPKALHWRSGTANATGPSSAGPPPPTLTATDPASPANDNSPRMRGTAQAGSTVRLYETTGCSGAAAVSGSAAEFASPGLLVSVPDDSKTTFRATATDLVGNTSGCSSDSITYVEDSTAPAPPRLTDTDPDSPANQNSIEVKGNAVAKPWFLYLAPTAPHEPLAPESKYVGATVPEFQSNPSFFESDTSDKPPFIAQTTENPAAILNQRTAQLRMLMSVDDLVAQVFSALEAAGEANDTLAFFVSDNGYLWGEHGLKGKAWPYTDSAMIPFYMRWPGRISGGAADPRIVANVDLAPTVMNAAGLDEDPAMDGMSLLGSGSRGEVFLESLFGAADFGLPIRTWASVRSASQQYTEWYGDDDLTTDDEPVYREYYDLAADPWQLTNYLGDADPANDPAPDRIAALHDQLRTGLNCAGRNGVADRPPCGPGGSFGPGGQGHPNILFIVTDDQRPTETLDVMPKTKKLFDDQGTYFPNAFATTPLCCPSRASILTGRYAHNHGVKVARYAPRIDESATIEQRLQEAGYRTGIYGKFFSNWKLTKNPRHFDQWSLFNNGPYTNFKANEQGQMKTITQYATSYVADKAAEFIRQQEDRDRSTVRIYRAPTTADCTSENLVATGSPAEFASPGLDVSLPDDTTTTLRATATDTAGNSSACSFSSIDFNEDSTAPPAPTLTDTDPDSPADHNSPRVRGSAEPGSEVGLYATDDCTGAAEATGFADELDFPGLELAVPDDSTTTLHARATDEAGNSSGCSPGSATYVEDSANQTADTTAPAAPELTDVDPDSPANDNSPKVTGRAEAGTAVRLYTTDDCSGPAAATGSAEEFETAGMPISVPDDSSTAVRATATDDFDNVSACSSSAITIVEDSTAPFAPVLKATSPASPANHNAPKVKGTVDAGTTVRIYKAAAAVDCTPANLVATGAGQEFASAGLTVSVADNSTTRFRATATDAAGNTSVGSDFFGTTAPCSLTSVVYTEDSTPPPGPMFSGTVPASPANNNSPKVKGTAQAGSSVRLYKAETRADCIAGNLAATGTAATFASPGLTVTIRDNFSKRFRTTATDAAGNTSVCSASSIVYTEDSTPPAEPTISATVPASPASANSPQVKGAAEAGSTVRVYKAPTTTGCFGANLLATGIASTFASPGLAVAVADNSRTRFRARANDAAGNTSACSASSILYIEDSTLGPMAITESLGALSFKLAPPYR